MAEDNNEIYQEPYAMQQAMDSDNPVTEPVLTQLDDRADWRLTKGLYKWEIKYNPDTERWEKVPTELLFPDLETDIGYFLTHLNMNMNLTWEDSRILYRDALTHLFSLLQTKYKRNPAARTIILNMLNVFQRNIIESVEGSHQVYNTKMGGSHRTVEAIEPRKNNRRGPF